MHVEEKELDEVIDHVKYHHFEGTTMTVCCVVLKNGWMVLGQAACIDPNEFDEEIGKKWSLEDAKEKIWHVLGYEKFIDFKSRLL